jgi:hypothetical protein
MEIEVRPTFDRIAVLINGIPHLSLDREKLVGFQSWKENTRYTIEWTFSEGAVIITEYDDKDKWSAILKEVDVILTPSLRKSAGEKRHD